MRSIYRFILFLGLLSVSLSTSAYTVVIDAGHGGKDAGAIGSSLRLKEKDLNLEVSLRLASLMRTAYPDIKVVLTRSSDVFLPLQQRADIVNRNNADLFICIHTNAAQNRSARGAETFILGTDRMEDNLDVAMRENAVMKLEADYQTQYQGFDPNSVESYIMFELMQNTYMNQSLQFASLVQTQFASTLKRDDRGVRQAAFWVLLKSACPSVLVEMGFVSNKEEEQYMASDLGKRQITEAIFTAFSRYYTSLEHKHLQPAEPVDSAPVVSAPDTIVKPTEKKAVKSEDKRKKVTEKSVKEAHLPKTDTVVKPRIDTIVPVPEDTIVPVPAKDTVLLIAQKEVPQVSVSQEPVLYYHIQLFASRKMLKEGDPAFRGLKGCTYLQRGEWYKYVYGNYATEQEAEQERLLLETKFPGCFIIRDNR